MNDPTLSNPEAGTPSTEADSSAASCSLRYFVDERGGCVAVRDRENTDPDYPGLHSDTRGVIKYWSSSDWWNKKTCSHCGSTTGGFWEVPDEALNEAEALRDELNSANPAGLTRSEAEL